MTKSVPPEAGLMWLIDSFGRIEPVQLYHNDFDSWKFHRLGSDEASYLDEAIKQGSRLIGKIDVPVIP